MKETVQVSLMQVSFNFEKDAYLVLEDYLKLLKKHYISTIGHEEIINDIEERVAELLIEDGYKEKVVSKEMVEKIIAILGKPNDIDVEPENESSNSSYNYKEQSGDNNNSNPRLKKSIYRDIQNRLLGGVCSGFAAYTNIDVTWIRIVMLSLFFASLFLHFGESFLYIILAYCILWVVIPPARTVAQRCAMEGKSTRLDDIKKDFEETFKDNFRKVSKGTRDSSLLDIFGRVLKISIGIFLIGLGIVGIMSGSLLFVGFDSFFGFIPINIPDYLMLNMENNIWLKISSVLVYFLPFIGMFYVGVMLCFNFQTPKWRPGFIIFILWIVALICTSIMGFISFAPYLHHEEYSIDKTIDNKYDTLYVKYSVPKEFNVAKRSLRMNSNYLSLYYVKKQGFNKLEFAVYPFLNIYRNYEGEKSVLRCNVNTVSDFYFENGLRSSKKIEDDILIKDSLIIVNPRIYSKALKYDGKFMSMALRVPEKTVVILQEPEKHVFEAEEEYND